MPNRFLKDSIRTSDSVNMLTWFEEVLFYRLIVSADDFGRFDARPAIIKGSCFPLKTGVTESQIEKALSALETAGMVCRYMANGKPYLQFLQWEQHQQTRAKSSKYPAPDDIYKLGNQEISREQSHCNVGEKPGEEGIPENLCNHMISDDSKCSRIRIRERNTNTKTNTNTMCKADADALFESLWALYPCKKGKGQVSDSKKMALLRIGKDEMCRAVERYRTELGKDHWRKPQNGSTFFNSGYIDYLDVNYVPGERQQASDNPFNRFEQHDYDFDALEKELGQG